MGFIPSDLLTSQQVKHVVDPSLASDTGAGTLGNPYGDLQYALDQVGLSGRDATVGDHFYIKGGTDEILAAPLSLATYGIPTVNAGLTFEGFTSVLGDGGQGGISGNGSHTILDAALTNSNAGIAFRNLHLHNCGAQAQVLRLPGSYSSVVGCEINDCDGIGIDSRSFQAIVDNNLYDLGGVAAIRNDAGSSSEEQMFVAYNYYRQTGSRSVTSAIDVGRYGYCYRNILSLGVGETGIRCNSATYWMHIRGNSILCNAAGTGQGIAGNQGSSISGSSVSISGNLVEGFSGTGGDGIEVSEFGGIFDFSFNGVYNCTNPYLGVVNIPIHNVDNETLGASPFAKSGADTFANRHVYFAPANQGNVLAGYYGVWDKGAVQTLTTVSAHNWDLHHSSRALLTR